MTKDVIIAEIPYSMDEDLERTQRKIDELKSTEMTPSNAIILKERFDYIRAGLTTPVQLIESQVIELEKTIEKYLKLAKTHQFSEDGPYAKCTTVFRQQLGMLKTDIDLRNMLADILFTEREKLYGIVGRFIEQHQEIALLHAKKDILEKEIEKQKNEREIESKSTNIKMEEMSQRVEALVEKINKIEDGSIKTNDLKKDLDSKKQPEFGFEDSHKPNEEDQPMNQKEAVFRILEDSDDPKKMNIIQITNLAKAKYDMNINPQYSALAKGQYMKTLEDNDE